MIKLRQTIGSLQDYEELCYFSNFIKNLRITKYLEIGSYKGETFYSAIVNSPKGTFGLSVDNLTFGENILGLTEELNSLGYYTKSIQGDSKDPEVVKEVLKHSPFDVVFIDGDHTYEGVKSDWLNYSQMSDIVVFHDVYAPKDHNGWSNDVRHFWEELKENSQFKETREFHKPGSGMGYGIVFK